MRLSFLALASVGPVLLASACAPVGPVAPDGVYRPADQCLMSSQITNFHDDGERTLYLRVLRSDVYQLETSGNCRDLESTSAIALTPQTGSGRLCVGETVNVVMSSATEPPPVCRARIVRRLTPAEIAALPDTVRP